MSAAVDELRVIRGPARQTLLLLPHGHEVGDARRRRQACLRIGIFAARFGGGVDHRRADAGRVGHAAEALRHLLLEAFVVLVDEVEQRDVFQSGAGQVFADDRWRVLHEELDLTRLIGGVEAAAGEGVILVEVISVLGMRLVERCKNGPSGAFDLLLWRRRPGGDLLDRVSHSDAILHEIELRVHAAVEIAQDCRRRAARGRYGRRRNSTPRNRRRRCGSSRANPVQPKPRAMG